MFESGGNTVIDERRGQRVAKRSDGTLSLLAVRRLPTVEHASGSQNKDDHSMAKQSKNNDANLGFEAKLFAAADKLRGNMEPSAYKHVALGLIFLKYISDAFEAKRAELLDEELADAERLLGPEAIPLVASASQGQAADDRQGH